MTTQELQALWRLSDAGPIPVEIVHCDCGVDQHIDDTFQCEHRSASGRHCGATCCVRCGSETGWTLRACPSHEERAVARLKDNLDRYERLLRDLSVTAGEDRTRYLAKKALRADHREED